MAAFSQQKLREILIKRLKLVSPQFQLEKLPRGKVSGSVISDTFMGRSNINRQQDIWAALEDELGSTATTLVGTLLAYTTAEWNVPLGNPAPRCVDQGIRTVVL